MQDKDVLVHRTDEFLAVIGGMGGRGSLSAKDSIMLLSNPMGKMSFGDS